MTVFDPTRAQQSQAGDGGRDVDPLDGWRSPTKSVAERWGAAVDAHSNFKQRAEDMNDKHQRPQTLLSIFGR